MKGSKVKCEVRYKELKEYLQTLTYKDFEDKESVDYMEKAFTADELEKWPVPRKDITLSQWVDYGMPFLVDVIGNDLSVVWLTKRKYKVEGACGERVVNCKLDKTLIDDCRKAYGTPLNGYWAIPEEFIFNRK